MITDTLTSTFISPIVSPYPPPPSTGGGAEIEILQTMLMWAVIAFGPLLLGWLFHAIKIHFEQLRQHQNWQDVQGIVGIAVNAAEQLGLSGQLAEYGDTKLDYALAAVEAMLEARGLKIDLDAPVELLKTLIEAEVRKL